MSDTTPQMSRTKTKEASPELTHHTAAQFSTDHNTIEEVAVQATIRKATLVEVLIPNKVRRTCVRVYPEAGEATWFYLDEEDDDENLNNEEQSVDDTVQATTLEKTSGCGASVISPPLHLNPSVPEDDDLFFRDGDDDDNDEDLDDVDVVKTSSTPFDLDAFLPPWHIRPRPRTEQELLQLAKGRSPSIPSSPTVSTPTPSRTTVEGAIRSNSNGTPPITQYFKPSPRKTFVRRTFTTVRRFIDGHWVVTVVENTPLNASDHEEPAPQSLRYPSRLKSDAEERSDKIYFFPPNNTPKGEVIPPPSTPPPLFLEPY